ncbi:MAG: hypothetical protein LQ343_005548 [Gyalolechia ehrenbergii]|nr:MAG: hypothetical protein LQ343_005548 [Gyalolechia ehrenbergii]
MTIETLVSVLEIDGHTGRKIICSKENVEDHTSDFKQDVFCVSVHDGSVSFKSRPLQFNKINFAFDPSLQA